MAVHTTSTDLRTPGQGEAGADGVSRPDTRLANLVARATQRPHGTQTVYDERANMAGSLTPTMTTSPTAHCTPLNSGSL